MDPSASRSHSPIDDDTDSPVPAIATHDDVDMATPAPPPPSIIHLTAPYAPSYAAHSPSAALPPSRPYSGGAYHHRSHASGSTRASEYPPDYRHTRHDARHAPYPAPSARRSHTPRTSPEEEDIGSSDSSSNSSDYSSDSDASRDELDDDDVPSQPPKTGFGFSAATWSSTNPSPNPSAAPPPVVHRSAPYERERVRTRDRPRVIYEDSHYEKKDVHYVMEERHSSRYYPASHPHHPPPSSYTTREHRAYSGSSAHYPRRSSISPEHSYSYPSASYRRPVSPEPLYKEYREYRDNRHHRERERERERISRTSRSSQTSPVRVEPVHPTGPRTFIRMLTPSRYRRPLASPISDLDRESRWERDQDVRERDRERKLEREREEREEREREREREKQREIQRAKYQYESRVPPPPPSLSAPLTLRPPPLSRDNKTLSLSNARMGAPRSTNGTTNPLSSNAHTANQYLPGTSPPPGSKLTTKRSTKSRVPPDAFAPPRMVIPGPGGRKVREDEEYDLGEDEMDEDEDEEYQPGIGLVPSSTTGAPISVSASASSLPRRANSMGTKRAGLLTAAGGSSTSTFALSGGPSAPANNNGTTSTTTTFHVTTPRAISASLAAAQNAASQAGSAAAQAEAEKAEAEKMRIPSFKRGGKTRYQCVYCSKDFSRKNDAYRHMSRKHNDNATEFICVCGRVLSRGDALTRHMRTCRESKEKGSGVGVVVGMPGGGFVTGAGGPPAKVGGVIPGQGKRKGGKKRKGVPPPAGMEMEVEGEEELIDNDVSMEEED